MLGGSNGTFSFLSDWGHGEKEFHIRLLGSALRKAQQACRSLSWYISAPWEQLTPRSCWPLCQEEVSPGLSSRAWAWNEDVSWILLVRAPCFEMGPMQSLLWAELFFNREASKANLWSTVHASQAGCLLATSAGWQALPHTGWPDCEAGKEHKQLRQAHPNVHTQVWIQALD